MYQVYVGQNEDDKDDRDYSENTYLREFFHVWYSQISLRYTEGL